MKMIDRPIAMPQIETRLYACFDVTDSHFHRVRYVVGPIGSFGEGDAGGDCCYNGKSAHDWQARWDVRSCFETPKAVCHKQAAMGPEAYYTPVTVESRGAEPYLIYR